MVFMKYPLSHNNNEFVSFVTTWSSGKYYASKISSTKERKLLCYHSHMESKETNV